MTPGPTIIRECPSCTKSVREETLASGNTFGATFWSDGKREAPMLPSLPDLVRCPFCNSLFWLSKARKLKSVDPWRMEEPSEEDGADPIEPVAEDFLEAIRIGLAKDADQEQYFRIRAWHAANDLLRYDPNLPVESVISGAMVENMRAIYSGLDKIDPGERIMMAELSRELGDTDQALQLLEFDFEEGYWVFVNVIKDLAAKGDRRVAEIKVD